MAEVVESSPVLSALDERILNELQLDGRQSASSLAKKLGLNYAYTCYKLRMLLSSGTIRVGAYVNTFALGYNYGALIGADAPARESGAIADRFAAYPNVPLVMVGMGWHDVLAMALFRSESDMRLFVGNEIGTIPGMRSVEVLTMTEAFKPMPQVIPPAQGKDRGGTSAIDHIDLVILSEIERDGRQGAAQIAKKLGMDRGIVSARLKRILDERIATIAVLDISRGTGWQIPAVIALRVSPTDIQCAVREVGELTRPEWFVRVVGVHDLVVGATFLDSRDLLETLRGLRRQLVRAAGVVSVDIMIGLELRKMAYDNLATPLVNGQEAGLRKKPTRRRT